MGVFRKNLDMFFKCWGGLLWKTPKCGKVQRVGFWRIFRYNTGSKTYDTDIQ